MHSHKQHRAEEKTETLESNTSLPYKYILPNAVTIDNINAKDKRKDQNLIRSITFASSLKAELFNHHLLLLRIEPRVPKTAKASKGLTSSVSKTGGIMFLKRLR